MREPFRTRIDSVRGREVARRPDAIRERLAVVCADQTLHLARVRREHEGQLKRAAQFCGPGGEGVQAVGVNHHGRRAALDKLADEAARAFVFVRKAGADGDHVRARGEGSALSRSASKLVAPPAVSGSAAVIISGIARAATAACAAAASQSSRGRPRSASRPCRKDGCARQAARARNDERVPVRVLVRIRRIARPDEPLARVPFFGQEKSATCRRFEQRGRRADVGDNELAVVMRCGRQDVRGLGRREGDGQIGLDGFADERCRIRVEARREVEGDNQSGVPRARARAPCAARPGARRLWRWTPSSGRVRPVPKSASTKTS